MHLLYSCGKTSLAYLILGLVSKHGGVSCVKLSAVYASVVDLKQVVTTATNNRVIFGKRTVLFLDEIHRFNKSQQDALLPYLEDGVVTLIGATTENPSVALNRSLLSRCRTLALEKLSTESLRVLVDRAVCDTMFQSKAGGRKVEVEQAAFEALVRVADGDGRVALNTLEQALVHAVHRGGSAGCEGRDNQRDSKTAGGGDAGGQGACDDSLISIAETPQRARECAGKCDVPGESAGMAARSREGDEELEIVERVWESQTGDGVVGAQGDDGMGRKQSPRLNTDQQTCEDEAVCVEQQAEVVVVDGPLLVITEQDVQLALQRHLVCMATPGVLFAVAKCSLHKTRQLGVRHVQPPPRMAALLHAHGRMQRHKQRPTCDRWVCCRCRMTKREMHTTR